MIIVTVKDNSISITGHACRKEPSGIDRACTAVSALTCSLINSLQDLTHDKIKVDARCGNKMGRSIRWWETSGRFMVPGTYRCQPGIQLHRISEINIREGVFIMSKT